MVRAAVFHEVGQPEVEFRDDVEVLGPDAGEVRVRVRASGVCHTDLSALDGTMPQPPPCVLGHEGAGDVVAVGDDVRSVAVGDRVIVAWTAPCGNCPSCLKSNPYLCLHYVVKGIQNPRFRVGETPYFGMAGTGTFAEELTLAEAAVVKIPDDVPYEIGALIGCGVVTGVGSVVNVARVEPGSTVAVVGCGGVGISVIQGARIAGAAEIVAIDKVEQKLDWAKRFGATRGVTSEEAESMKADPIAGDGFDYVFEVVGLPATIRAAYDLTRRGGTTVIVGAGRADQQVTFTPFELFFSDRTILPSTYGGAFIRRDFDRMIRLWRSGQLDIEGMITRTLELEELNDAFAAMKSGEVIRQVVTLG